ncbi:MAG TPA: acyl-CoA dehydrogenase family protein [Actinomycetota bacterium]|jgi:alkylation response protein AidB-like acyl-CoA dehydrogenase|nr:acyl-CoA dehydrogenase family protein [Actinomycetota bacterium]
MAIIAELTDVQKEIVQTVRDFVEKDVIPIANDLEHRDEYPEEIVEKMKEIGLFGLKIPEEYGGLGEPLTTYALVVVELARGWMSLSGILNTHFITAWQLETFGTDEQKKKFLPRMATGEVRAALSMTEPHAGSDSQAIKCKAIRDGDVYRVTGTKMWVTNGLRSGIVMLMCKTDPDADPPRRGIGMLIVEKEPGASKMPGLEVSPNIDKLGYKGVETTELIFDDYPVPVENLLGGEEGQGFYQVMAGIEVGRVNVAARAIGVATRAFEEAIRYAQERETFGRPIAQHQAIQFKLADMATQIEAARLLMLNAAQRKDAGERTDLEAGMAKLFASEMCMFVTTEALRIHGGYGYSKEFTVERLYRDAPFFIIGEGTSEIQKRIIGRQLVERYKI